MTLPPRSLVDRGEALLRNRGPMRAQHVAYLLDSTTRGVCQAFLRDSRFVLHDGEWNVVK